MIFSTIQLADAILWYIKMKKNEVNYYVTSYMIPTILSMQILYNVFIRNDSKNVYINSIAIMICIYLFIRFNGYSSSLCKNDFSSPIWASKEIKLHELLIFMLFILYPNLKKISLTLFIIFPLVHILAGGAYGSLWCSIANYVAFDYLYRY